MLHSMNDLEQYAIRATDGTIGHVTDFYFDNVSWVIRYLVVDTGIWLLSRSVLISPISIGHPNWAEKVLPVAITKEQVKNSPSLDTHKPVSRQQEIEYLRFYGYPFYWSGTGIWGGGIYPNMLVPGYAGLGVAPVAERPEVEEAYARADMAAHKDDDPHLRSCKAIVGYHIQASDGELGHIQGLLVDETTWSIRYLVVDTSNWWFGHKVLIAPQWIQDVNWEESVVSVDMTQQAVKEAPPYDSAVQLNREQEMGIHQHYARLGYWTSEEEREINQTDFISPGIPPSDSTGAGQTMRDIER